MIIFKKRVVTIAETRFGPDAAKGYGARDYPGVDIIHFLQNPEPIPSAKCEEAFTLLHDLALTPEVLLSEMHKTTRYEIVRAREKDHLTYQGWRAPDAQVIAEFCEFFSKFSVLKGVPDASGGHLRDLARAGCLDLSQMRSDQGVPLTWHVHLIEKGRSRLMHSASARLTDDNGFRNLVGRANRLHHWEDMLRFRSEGCRVYDFGGWYNGQEDQECLQINQFKERFGGKPEKSFNCELPLTWRGRGYLQLKKILRRKS